MNILTANQIITLNDVGFFDWIIDHPEYENFSSMAKSLRVTILTHFIFEKYEKLLITKEVREKTTFDVYMAQMEREIFSFLDNLITQ